MDLLEHTDFSMDKFYRDIKALREDMKVFEVSCTTNQGIDSLLLSIKTMLPVIEELLLDKELEVDAFICPGHVSTIEIFFMNIERKGEADGYNNSGPWCWRSVDLGIN